MVLFDWLKKIEPFNMQSNHANFFFQDVGSILVMNYFYCCYLTTEQLFFKIYTMPALEQLQLFLTCPLHKSKTHSQDNRSFAMLKYPRI